MLDFGSFFIGYFVCMICDVVFSLCSFLISRALFYKAREKVLKEQETLLSILWKS